MVLVFTSLISSDVEYLLRHLLTAFPQKKRLYLVDI